MRIFYFLLFFLIITLSGCTTSNKNTPIDAIKNYSEHTEEIMQYSTEDDVVIFKYQNDNKETFVIGSLTNDDQYEYNGNREVSIVLPTDSENKEDSFFYSDQYVHPISNKRYIWGIINNPDVTNVEVKYYNNNDELIYSKNSKTENNVFMMTFDGVFTNVSQRVFILKDSEGAIIKEYKY